MAAIGKIRSWGPWLVGIIGLALFGFIATDFTRSCETSSNQARQQVGEVMGNKLSIQDYQSDIEEFKNVFNFIGQEIPDEQLREFVWNNYVQNTIIEEEAEKLGLGVTDDELRIVLATGTHPLLQRGSLPLLPDFYNQQTGAFDYNNVTQIYTLLQQQAPDRFAEFDRYWKTIEKLLRQNLLTQKYMTLLSACMLSNEASAKVAFDGRNTETQIELASLAFSTINDNDVQISDADLKAKYNEQKEMFKWNTETRDIKYVVCNIVPSEQDLKTLTDGLEQAAAELRADSMPLADILASHRSVIEYTEGLPYNAAGIGRISPALKAALDTLHDGDVTAPFTYSAQQAGKPTQFMAVARLNRRYNDVDSINYQYIPVAGQTPMEASRVADSLLAVIKAGTPFDSVSTSTGATAASAWLSANAYQGEENVSPEFVTLFKALHTASVNEPKKITLDNSMVVLLNVTERRQPVALYDVAIVSNEVRPSNDTYENTYNQFSQYVSECSTPDDLDKNAAKYNYVVQEQKNLSSTAYTIGANAQLANTREIVKWVYAEAKEGNISPKIYRNDADGHYIAVALTKVHPVGYLDQQSVEDYLRAEVLKDKKADLLTKQLAGATTVAEAQQKGALVDTISHISFPTTVTVKGQREVGLSGAVAATQPGQTVKHVVRGSNGVFLFKVIERTPRGDAEFERRQQENALVNNAIMVITPSQYNPYTGVFDVLREKCGVKDNRFLF